MAHDSRRSPFDWSPWLQGSTGWWGAGNAPTGMGMGWTTSRLLETLSSRLVGRTFTLRPGGHPLRFTLDAVAAEGVAGGDASPLGTQLPDVRIEAHDVHWRDLRCEWAEVRLRNIQVRLGPGTTLVAAPVRFTLRASGETLAALVAEHGRGARLQVTDDARFFARWSRHPDLGRVEVVPEVDGTRLSLRAVGLARGSRTVGLPVWLPPLGFRLPLPIERCSLHAVRASGDGLEVEGVVDELRFPLGSADPQALVRRLGDLSR